MSKKKNKKKEFNEELNEEKVSETEGTYDWEGIKPEDASSILKGIEAIIPEVLKKTIVQGVGSMFNEEGIRSAIGENKKIPKEAMNFLFNQGDSMRKEILRMVSNEVRVFLENMDFGGEIAKILTTLSFEIKTEVRFIPNDERVRPQIKNSVKVKRNKTKKEKEKTKEKDELFDDKEPAKTGFSRWRRKKEEDSEE